MLHRSRRRLIALVAVISVVGGVIATSSLSQAEPNTPVATDRAGNAVGVPIRAGGQAAADGPREVNVAALPDATEDPGAGTKDLGALRIDGTRGPGPAAKTSDGKVNAAGPAPQVSTPNVIKQSFPGTVAAQSSCGCQPPDPNGAASASFVVEADNLSLQTWTRGTPVSLLKRVSFASFLGTSDSLSDPRVLFDNAWKRWVLMLTVVPASSGDTPAMWLATSQTSDPRGAWWIYRPTFGGGFYPLGTLLDYPMVGMDQDAFLFSTNNFVPPGFTYNNTAVLSVAKQRIYNGLGWSAAAFGVAFSAHPAIVEGLPQNGDPVTYVVASQLAYGGTGFDVYAVASSARSPSVTFLGSAASAAISQPNCAMQPGGGTCLDALDGRLQAAPKQLSGLVWWTRAAGFPVVEYGAITIAGLTSQRAVAYLAGSSFDWNPSIAVSDAGGGQHRVFISWAVTDPSTGLNVSFRESGLNAGDPIQNLIGVGTTVATGGHGNDFRFGDYSSTQIDPGNPNGKVAQSVNEMFAGSGQWQNRVARYGFA